MADLVNRTEGRLPGTVTSAPGDQITHVWCPASGAQPGEDNSTHHLLHGGLVPLCRDCRLTTIELRDRIARGLELLPAPVGRHRRAGA